MWWVSCACCWVRWCCRRWSGCWWRRLATSSPYTPTPTPGQTSPPSPTQVRCLLQRIPTTKNLYLQSTTVDVPSSAFWDSPNPSPAGECPPPLNQRVGWGGTLTWGWGVGSPNSDDWRKSLALCLLCDRHHLLPYTLQVHTVLEVSKWTEKEYISSIIFDKVHWDILYFVSYEFTKGRNGKDMEHF